jgi:hypothetical protein
VLSSFRSHLTYANVMATIGVFLALGGTSVAAESLEKNSVSSNQVKNSSLTGNDIKNSSLTTSDVKDKSLLAKDFKAGQLPRGARGAAGSRGAAGATGATGSSGLTGGTGPAAASFLGGQFNAGNTAGFVSPVGTSTLNATDVNVAILSPARTIVARDLAVNESSRPAGDARIYTLAVNGVLNL